MITQKELDEEQIEIDAIPIIGDSGGGLSKNANSILKTKRAQRQIKELNEVLIKLGYKLQL